jgi:hypothetical protein
MLLREGCGRSEGCRAQSVIISYQLRATQHRYAATMSRADDDPKAATAGTHRS